MGQCLLIMLCLVQQPAVKVLVGIPLLLHGDKVLHQLYGLVHVLVLEQAPAQLHGVFVPLFLFRGLITYRLSVPGDQDLIGFSHVLQNRGVPSVNVQKLHHQLFGLLVIFLPYKTPGHRVLGCIVVGVLLKNPLPDVVSLIPAARGPSGLPAVEEHIGIRLVSFQ